MRKAFSDTMIHLAEKDERIIFLTGDLGFQVFSEFEEKFPERYINAGIAEAQLVNTAAGLALEGMRPIIYSIAPFITSRPYEQLKFSVAYHGLPVMVVGAGGGYTYAKAGVTHHAPDDLMLMSSLPGFSVVVPGGPDEMSILMKEMLNLDGPSYLRVGKFGEPNVGRTEEVKVRLGKARILAEGEDLAIVTVGDVISELSGTIQKICQSGKRIGHYHFHTVKPVDESALSGLISRYRRIAVFEESLCHGGIYDALCGAVVKNRCSPVPEILRFGAPENQFVIGNPSRQELRARLGITSENIERLAEGLKTT